MFRSLCTFHTSMRNMAHIIDYVNDIFLTVTAIVLIVVYWFVRHFLIGEYFSKEFNDGQCSICLNPHENKSLPRCGHVYCYQCLVDWCRIKLECPTCKRPFKMFKHSIRSWINFRIHVPVTSSSVKFIEDFHHHHQSSSTEDELFQEYFQSTVDLILPPL